MKRRYTTAYQSCLLATILLIFSAASRAQNHETTIKVQAMDMAKATLNKDLDKFLTYMHPKLVEFAGGKEKIRSMMDTLNKGMAMFGAKIKKITIGHPYKVVTYNKILESTLPQTTELKWMSGTVTLETTLIALSEDEGKHWYFIDTNVYSVDKLKNVLPALSPDLVIPPRKQPKIVADEE